MRLVGWNDLPAGYGADFDLREAPLWLRVWSSTPLLDRFAYPVVVRRGYGWLMLQPGHEPARVGDGWRVRPADFVAPGSVTLLRRWR